MTMDHAAAHEELADLTLEPRRLSGLAHDPAPRAVALRAHLAECRTCRVELDGWRSVYAALDVTTADGGLPLRSLEPVEPPGPSATLRGRTLAALGRLEVDASDPPRPRPREVGDASDGRGEAGRRRVRSASGPGTITAPRRTARLAPLGWLAAAAALVLAIGVGGLLVQRSGEVTQARQEALELAAATATLDRVLAAPTHWVATLRTADGAAGGTLAWSPTEVVVLTSALTSSGPGTTYRCWIERDGMRTPVGSMSFSSGIGYWAGSTSGWGTMEPGSRFGVTAVPASGSGGSAVLVADL